MKFKRMCWRSAFAILALGVAANVPVSANPALVVDAATGEVLYHDMATAPWFPASLTKLMTTYVALSKVREGKISLDTPLRISAYASSMPPSKMGFRPGTLVTLDNALKMLMVKSPNDIAVAIAEGISGSVPAFADEMNASASKLGLHESHFVNPNGLPDPNHVSSARDMAMIGRALLREFPEQGGLFNIGALAFGNQIISNHNGLLGRYPGIDGMKTGYTCSAGYNVVESATRGDKRLLVVVLGAPSTNERNLKAVSLFERFFGSPGSDLGPVAELRSGDVVAAPDLRGQICGPGRHNAIMEAEAEDASLNLTPAAAAVVGKAAERADVLGTATAATVASAGPAALIHARDPVTPLRVFIGPAKGSTLAAVGAVGAVEAAAPGPGATPAELGTAPPAVAVSRVPDLAGSAVDPALTAPLALAGAVPPPAALTAANRVVKSKGRLSLRVPAKAAPAAVRPVASKSAGKATAAKAVARPAAKTSAKAPKRKKAASK